ncbi:cadherin-like and PC-esterase domain-containing protein 1 [Gigantopelta aegis]|uniref:cadherin-like and PC-esterase domain-containing protein 1 n=1 Tax=Gigantopelta aegis TaxID=1735272 RepID=UPI001B889FE7|nr:cadherin-like and PC-esterase domain-containing protein 1 [Gigantopelta aegis]
MSLSPLRLYLHPEGLAWEGFSSYMHKKPQRSVTVQEFQQLIADTGGQDISSAAMAQLEEAIVRAMFMLESTANQRKTGNNCQSCFQLLEVTMVFNTTFHPFLLQVKPYAHKGKMASLNEYVVRQRILEDLAVMLVSKETVVGDVAMGLGELGLTFPTQNGLCNFDESFCLSNDQLLYSLDNRREFFKKGNFIKLYPSTSAVKYTSLLQTMYPVSRGVTGLAATPAQTGGHTTSTADLHSYLLSLESFYADLDKEDTVLSYDDMNIPIDFEVVPNINSSSLHNSKRQSISHVPGQIKVHCDKDPASMPYLKNLYINPKSTLSPEFSPFMTEYHITVDYDVLHIAVWAFAKSCSSQARMEDKHGVSRVGNFTVGIGENRISVVVVDMSYAEPWVLNTYTLVIQRLAPDYQLTSLLPGLPHQVCSLKQVRHSKTRVQNVTVVDLKSWGTWLGWVGGNRQWMHQRYISLTPDDLSIMPPRLVYFTLNDLILINKNYDMVPTTNVMFHFLQDCALRFAPRESCGLQVIGPTVSWSKFLEKSSSLPQCRAGDESGKWYVPCKSCTDTHSCYWQQAIWQPDGCRYQWLPRGKVKQCFAGKKVLFIGDSTNRGILHYIMEQVNGSLHEWDKTHHLRVYSMLNHNHTAFSFAYYPQFWLPAEHRPVLDKALYQLIKKNKPLQNNSNTVLVVGGVHWLAKHHIDVVLKALNRQGLTGIRLVVKGLGSGFHQPVSGVHCLSKKDHQRLLSHNLATLRYAKTNGFSVIDTYNMTMARYKDFLQGKCACHFHRVTMTKKENVKKSVGSKRLVKAVSTGSEAVYHVEGEINAAYSEMMISQICRGS